MTTTTQVEIRRGAYYDSVVLMQLQRSLAGLPGVMDAGVVMGTEANKELLAESDLLPAEARAAAPDDLIIVVRAEDSATVQDALTQVDALLARRRSSDDQAYRPQSLEGATRQAPDAGWVLISVPGRFAAGVAREALRLGRNVFLYSDNVALQDEIALKQQAASQGLMVMGPDCGTAIVNGIGLGFANRVRRGPIGVVGASGTGLQAVTVRIHALGSGITHALGTGGRDLSAEVNAVSARQALDLLARDPETHVIVLVSKPPSPEVAARLLAQARATGKPVVVCFLAYDAPPGWQDGPLHFASTLDHAAELAVQLAGGTLPDGAAAAEASAPTFAQGQRFLRGLFSGGTLAYEAQWLLRHHLPGLRSNAPLKGIPELDNPHSSSGHAIVDLGGDEFTVGRLHPMMDNELRIRRLLQEAADPEVAVILLDVVLGEGAHADPASELGPAIARARALAEGEGRPLQVIALLVGTDLDPQGLDRQREQLVAAGAVVLDEMAAATQAVVSALSGIEDATTPATPDAPTPPALTTTAEPEALPPLPLETIERPLAAINVGLESFTESLAGQGAPAIQVEWRPPAGGNEKLMGILERMKQGRPRA